MPKSATFTADGGGSDDKEEDSVLKRRYSRELSAFTFPQVVSGAVAREPTISRTYYTATDELLVALTWAPPHRRTGRAHWNPVKSLRMRARYISTFLFLAPSSMFPGSRVVLPLFFCSPHCPFRPQLLTPITNTESMRPCVNVCMSVVLRSIPWLLLPKEQISLALMVKWWSLHRAALTSRPRSGKTTRLRLQPSPLQVDPW